MNGFNDFKKKLKDISAATAYGLEMVGVFVKGEAVVRCPVGVYPKGSGRVGGKLRGSITHKVEGSDYVRIGTNTKYAAYVEYGTSKMQAQPYLRPAIDENTDRIKKLFAEAIGAACDRK